jgi:hypothetical protein
MARRDGVDSLQLSIDGQIELAFSPDGEFLRLFQVR